ncbi:hypothetical protein GCM10011585_14590 [Edaphobacter dinghuensis]|uniref:Uncharacterized protein n=1 Tax=Edaphobacter dinghuensis TaxID=1560005 RepID=A0A917HAA9_9BACT|nr:hypothetical protein GCM10011585_14590 [Edaphobacter dinghuensis]
MQPQPTTPQEILPDKIKTLPPKARGHSFSPMEHIPTPLTSSNRQNNNKGTWAPRDNHRLAQMSHLSMALQVLLQM